MPNADLLRLFTAPAPERPAQRESAGTPTSSAATGLAAPTGGVNPATAGVRTATLGAIPYPRNDDEAAPVRVVLGRTIAGCPTELLDAWLVGNGSAAPVGLPAKLAVTDNRVDRVTAGAVADQAGRLSELFKKAR